MAGSYRPVLTALREIRLGDRIYSPGESIEGADLSFEDMRRFVWENPFIGLGLVWSEQGEVASASEEPAADPVKKPAGKKPAAKRRSRKAS